MKTIAVEERFARRGFARRTLKHAGGERTERAPWRIPRDNFFVTKTGDFAAPSRLCARAATDGDRARVCVDFPSDGRDAAAWFITGIPYPGALMCLAPQGAASPAFAARAMDKTAPARQSQIKGARKRRLRRRFVWGPI
jgi:hypothetical protein